LRPFSAWAFAVAEEKRLILAKHDLVKMRGHTTSSRLPSSNRYRRTLISSITPYSFILDSLDGCLFVLLLQVFDAIRQLCILYGTLTYVGPMLTARLPPLIVSKAQIISVLKLQVKIGSPSSHGLTFRACFISFTNSKRRSTHDKVIL
jgi:hypothetical protein